MPPSLLNEIPTRPGWVSVNRRKVHRSPSMEEACGDIHLGMMGVTVIHKDGSCTMYPWRVIDWVEFPPDGV